ncbi:MAG: sugar phosphate nucleotidyltransferase, partial [Pseudomonadota bacterium]
MPDRSNHHIPSHPDCAMILAAGLGLRMRPLTNHCPKPLLKLAGVPIIIRILNALRAHGLGHFVINSHYLKNQMHALLQADDITLLDEPDLLETGGAVLNARSAIGKASSQNRFLVANADNYWHVLAGPEGAIASMDKVWDEERMDMMLLLAPGQGQYHQDSRSDFTIIDHACLVRWQEGQGCGWSYSGMALAHPRIFDHLDAIKNQLGSPVFSLNLLFDRLIACQRLAGMVFTGQWFHLGTPKALADASMRLTHL